MAQSKNKKRNNRKNHNKKRNTIKLPRIEMPEFTCSICTYPIQDLSAALANKTEAMEPVHFDCVLKRLNEIESLGKNQVITYMGRGTFAVLEFPNLANKKEFSIIKTIEWEAKESLPEWRTTIADLFSKT